MFCETKIGYNLTNKETEWVDKIVKKSMENLSDRKLKPDFDSVYTTAIFAVTMFTRKLKLIKKSGRDFDE